MKNPICIFRKKEIWFPTTIGWIVILILSISISYLLIKSSYLYLSINKPYTGGFLVVDGALPDYAFDQSIKRFKQLQCELIVTTGGPVPIGSYHQRFSNFSEVGREKLIRFGFDPMKIIAIPGPHVLRDRTYNNAVSVKKWLDSTSIQTDVINILCVGPHARRTRLLYKRAFENQYKIGIISLSELGYDKDEWWKSSIGFRTVIGEIIAYLYVRCCFHPAYETQ